MKLNVLNVAYPLARVAPDTAGGAEQVLAQVAGATAMAGFGSWVVACEGSEVAGKLLAIPEHTGILDPETCASARAEAKSAIEEALASEDIDVLHFHGIDFSEYLPKDGPPALVTLHLPPDWYPPDIWDLPRPHTHLHCVSESQQQRCSRTDALWPVIGNGVDLGSFRPRHTKYGFALMLGRICPEKGFDIGLDAATRAGLPLWIGGQVYGYPEHQQYFEQEVQPRLAGSRHRFLGSVDPVRKRRLLRAAKCVLIPSLAPETSSLVAMEAAASGTPVIAFRSGALSEIVEDGRTGFLVNTAEQMAAAIERIGEISPSECRRRAEQRFSSEKTTAHYLASYRRAFAEEWRDLHDKCAWATPFSSAEWLSEWPLEITRVRRSGHLVALAAIGEMEHSDYRDVLAADEDAARELWDRLPPCTLDEIPPDSPILEWMQTESQEASWCPVTRLDSFRLSGTTRKHLRQQRKELESAGATFELAAPEHVDEYLQALFELHQQRWQGEGVLGSETIRSFHRRVAPAFAQRGWLRFHGIRVEGRLRAVLYAFARNGRVYYYLSGFDPALSPFGPGSLLIHEAMQHAIAQGDREFDFLRGVEPYKFRWGAENRINRRVVKQGAE